MASAFKHEPYSYNLTRIHINCLEYVPWTKADKVFEMAATKLKMVTAVVVCFHLYEQTGWTIKIKLLSGKKINIQLSVEGGFFCNYDVKIDFSRQTAACRSTRRFVNNNFEQGLLFI